MQDMCISTYCLFPKCFISKKLLLYSIAMLTLFSMMKYTLFKHNYCCCMKGEYINAYFVHNLHIFNQFKVSSSLEQMKTFLFVCLSVCSFVVCLLVHFYHLTKLILVDVNECQERTDRCGPSSDVMCFNTRGSHKCPRITCPTGFKRSNLGPRRNR